MNNSYRRIMSIEYKNSTFIVLRSNYDNSYAFIRHDPETNKSYYPTFREYIELSNIFGKKEGIAFFKNNKKKEKEYKFNYKILVGGLLLSSQILALIPRDTDLYSKLIARDNEFKSASYDETEIDGIDFTEDYYEYTEDYYDVIDISDYIDQIPINDPVKYPSSESNHETLPGTKVQYGYNTSYLTDVLGYETVTVDQITNAINNNKKISEEVKPLIIDYVKTIMDYYPGLDMRLFYENVKTLQIKNATKMELSGDTAAFYRVKENAIYVNPASDFKENTLDMVILRHELTHLINMYQRTIDGIDVNYGFQYNDDYYYTNEALTVILSTDAFKDRYSSDLLDNTGYPLSSNIMRVILNALPNLSIQQIFNNNFTYFTADIDRNTKSEIPAKRVFDKYEILSEQYYGEAFVGDLNEYAEIYEFIADLYRDNVLSDLNDEEDEEVIEWIQTRLRRGIKDEKLVLDNITIDRIREYNKMEKGK